MMIFFFFNGCQRSRVSLICNATGKAGFEVTGSLFFPQGGHCAVRRSRSDDTYRVPLSLQYESSCISLW